MTDILIIGGGVIGCAVARLLSAYEADITLVERGADVAEGASKANSGIVHAGFDAKPGTLKAKYNVEGSRVYADFCREVNAPYGQPGALVLAFTPEEEQTVRALYAQGLQNGVPALRLLSGAEALELEPNLNPEVKLALLAPTSGLTSPYELTCALADHAAVNGVRFQLETEVTTIIKTDFGYRAETNRGPIDCKTLVLCVGTAAGTLHNQIGSRKLTITPRKGEYYLLDHTTPLLFTSTIFQAPTKMGKGVLVSPTVHGNLLLGPTAQDVTDPLDVSTTADQLRAVTEKARLTWPRQNLRGTITTFAGVRAHEAGDDFVIGAVEGAPGAYEAAGIESPGLSAAPAIARALAEQIAGETGLAKKADWKAAPSREKPFYAMSTAERSAAVAKDPQYGQIICRCEQVTEAEIRAAIHRPVGARTIDAVKRRTRAGMGRCQGGFCSPRVLEILSQELGIDPTEVTKNGGESRLLVSTIQDALRKEGK